ncbi:PREDICTED: uncharacterized protein LOC103622617 [Corvus brachyrhynchos]|uniref:uncharacterized protein LOC103622617 n=1 Tax=Corvus brachyrhynchos TaxID=85066 RepID=UPI00081669F4|nr:PREDICTED: uncharacterized protein LOC103622617 [Corvus brachyrhynchos]
MAGTCRDSHFYYYGIKFALSAYATLFSILGLLILSVGIYAEVERQRHKTLEGIFLAPAVLLLLLGVTVFLVSFVGMVGSLRDNRTLLKVFFWVLLLIFLTELLLIFIEVIFENKMNEIFHSNIQAGIRHYYDDLDFKNILDFVQEKFSCCGGDEFRDWEVNQYHSCNGSGALACGVPHPCCIRRVPGGVVNTLCGYRTLDKEVTLGFLGILCSFFPKSQNPNARRRNSRSQARLGCSCSKRGFAAFPWDFGAFLAPPLSHSQPTPSLWEPEAQERLPGFASSGIGLRESCWIQVPSNPNQSMIPHPGLDGILGRNIGCPRIPGSVPGQAGAPWDRGGVPEPAVALSPVPQVLGLAMAWLYWQQLNEIHSRLDSVDFRLLETRDLSFASLDLSGAGWCWCLPREGGYIPVNPGNEEEEEEEEEEGAAGHSKV